MKDDKKNMPVNFEASVKVPRKKKLAPSTMFVHPKSDPREPQEYSQSKLVIEKTASSCVIL